MLVKTMGVSALLPMLCRRRLILARLLNQIVMFTVT